MKCYPICSGNEGWCGVIPPVVNPEVCHCCKRGLCGRMLAIKTDCFSNDDAAQLLKMANLYKSHRKGIQKHMLKLKHGWTAYSGHIYRSPVKIQKSNKWKGSGVF